MEKIVLMFSVLIIVSKEAEIKVGNGIGDMVKLLNPKIVGMRNYYTRRFSRSKLWKIEKYINRKFTKWYNRKRQRNYRMGNAVKITEITSKAGLARMCS
ncbi:MAG: group II intron maturase-specific domain-containing protein [Methanosarcina sp.]|nr:group II intron maturase-specific domain-containing protein [Methanosarcina sp.]MDD4402792.1 group II intron maturase-specific domain-containing protein [Desulfitobacteriaceae bacterium]